MDGADIAREGECAFPFYAFLGLSKMEVACTRSKLDTLISFGASGRAGKSWLASRSVGSWTLSGAGGAPQGRAIPDFEGYSTAHALSVTVAISVSHLDARTQTVQLVRDR